MMSLREYGRRKGISHTAVQQAINSGRLVKSIAKSEAGHWKIADEALADQEWTENTDQASPRNRISGETKRVKATASTPYEPRNPNGAPPAMGQQQPEAAASAPDLPEGRGRGGPTYAQSQAVRVAYQAKLSKLEFDQKSGKLVPADAVRVAIFNAARRCKDMLMGMPDRVAPLVLGQTELFEIQRVLTDEVRRVCVEISKLDVPQVTE